MTDDKASQELIEHLHELCDSIRRLITLLEAMVPPGRDKDDE